MAAVEGAAHAGATTQDLYSQYGKQIYSYCLHKLRSREEAEDAVQTTFLNAFRGLQRGATTQFEQAWLFKIAHNVCLARLTSSSRRRSLEAPNDFEVLQEIVPSREGEQPLELIGLEEALEQMPENQRRAILLREWQGLSYREIASELQLTQAAVEMLIFRARRALAGALEQPEEARGKVRAGRRLGALGSLLGALKTLLGGGAAIKAVSIAAAAIAVVGESAHHTIVHRSATASAAPAAATFAAQASTSATSRAQATARGTSVGVRPRASVTRVAVQHAATARVAPERAAGPGATVVASHTHTTHARTDEPAVTAPAPPAVAPAAPPLQPPPAPAPTPPAHPDPPKAHQDPPKAQDPPKKDDRGPANAAPPAVSTPPAPTTPAPDDHGKKDKDPAPVVQPPAETAPTPPPLPTVTTPQTVPGNNGNGNGNGRDKGKDKGDNPPADPPVTAPVTTVPVVAPAPPAAPASNDQGNGNGHGNGNGNGNGRGRNK